MHRASANPKFTRSRVCVRWLSRAFAVVLGLAVASEAFAIEYRYSAASNRIYVEEGGFATLSDIKAAVPEAPLELVDAANRVWLLSANMVIEDGSILVLDGESGDVAELRLKSDNNANPGNFVSIEAEYGGIDINGVKITSWDSAVNGPDTEFGDPAAGGFGRAFIRARSILAPDGVTPLESRMDIADSDIGHLGYPASEAYGLSWKVVGADPAVVNVYGDITNSKIHDNYFGIYTFGLKGGQWTGNEVYNNKQYGFDPHDDSDNLLIESNDVHHNGNHGIIASMRCDHLTIRNNKSWANAENGIILHKGSDDSVVEGNETHDNADAGIAVYESDRVLVANNIVLGNGLAGIRLSMGSSDNTIEANTISNGAALGLYIYKGNDVPPEGEDGVPRRNMVRNNTIQNNGTDAIKVTNADQTTFIGNTLANNGPGIAIQGSPLTTFSGNNLPDSVTLTLSGNDTQITRVDFTDEPRVGLKIDSKSLARFTDDNGAVFDPDEQLFTPVTGTNSVLELTADQIGQGSTVYTRKLFAQTNGETVLVNPTVWNTSGDMSKQWNAKVATTTSQVQFTVGDLTPGLSYIASRGSTVLGTFGTDSNGQLSFTDTPASVLTVSYSVTPSGVAPPTDTDGDGVPDDGDNCPAASNADQLDSDSDGVGDACELADADGDGISDANDNCPTTSNADQADSDGDGLGDACETAPPADLDGDGIDDLNDNCPSNANADQADADGDGIGDVCEAPSRSDKDDGGATGAGLLALLAAAALLRRRRGPLG